MNIIIPLCGKGERFSKHYDEPKPLIRIFEKELLFYTLDNITMNKTNKNIYIIINKNTLDVEDIIHKKYKNINIINIVQETRGAAETILIGLSKILKLEYNNLLIIDGDNYYTNDFISLLNPLYNSIFYFNDISENPQYSYIQLDDDNVIDIREKNKISNNANTGAYYFNNIEDFTKNCEYIIYNEIKFKNEYYISVVISNMLNEFIFKGIEIKKENYISLGTPELVNKYTENTHAFLFDLDGTLIISDHIYIKAWSNILSKYNIIVDEQYYKTNIQGNSDEYIINKLQHFTMSSRGGGAAPQNLDNNKIIIEEVSKLKDEYFNSNINKIIVINNSIEFIKKIKLLGHKIAIVTNCNRNVAENIIKYLNIENVIDLLVIGNECKKPKPYPDPYIKAINFFNIKNNNYYIFEDSKSGLLSAKGTTPKAIIGIDYYNDNFKNLLHNGANIIINDYSDENIIDYILSFDDFNNNRELKKNIYNLLVKKYDICDIIIYNNNLKGGFISDVLKLDIVLNDGNRISMVLKKENKDSNCLSEMVGNLKLYEREYYLYENIYPYLNINVPKYYGTVRNDDFETVGLLLENLNDENYTININMNNATLETILLYIKSLAYMHKSFANKNLIKIFKGLHRQNSKELNSSIICDFIDNNLQYFIDKWGFLLNDNIIDLLHLINKKYNKIQEKLSTGYLTLCHGDFKSPNIFCDLKNSKICVIDWQYICEGKGLQDVIFFMIESFESNKISEYFNIIIEHYYNIISSPNDNVNYNNLSESMINVMTDEKSINKTIYVYSREEYYEDITLSICYFPMLVAIWFGTIDSENLIDKNFPLVFIKKFIFFLNNYVNKNIVLKL